MKTEQKVWNYQNQGKWKALGRGSMKAKADLVIAFGQRDVIADPARFQEIKEFYPNAKVVMGSTAGEIVGNQVIDNSIVVTAIDFEHTDLKFSTLNMKDVSSSEEAGEKLAQTLPHEGLKHVFILSDGQMVNGTDLLHGLQKVLPQGTRITGGLAGDGANFQQTLVGFDSVPESGLVVAIGFYGDRINVGYGSVGGWDSFGPERAITRSEANVLYELDGQPALELYKNYLGEKAAELPASALLFPLSVRNSQDDTSPLVRTILNIDEEKQSMTFAGDIPNGGLAKLMKANFDNLIDGATLAAKNSAEILNTESTQLAILVSCVGRKLVLGQRIDDEVEGVKSIIGDKAAITGFYSYGELAPTGFSDNCLLHNQTMTITLLSEN